MQIYGLTTIFIKQIPLSIQLCAFLVC